MEFEGAKLAALMHGLYARAGADAEEGKIMPFGVGNKISAGMCDAVDLVKGVREVGYARRHPITLPEGSLSPCQKYAKSSKQRF
jgi:hypothetical protein